ncbi:MAG: aminotransferase class I/II-fold pyridoxal phosphate-dependent enzyme, partial [Pseudomonadota bacterium]
GITYDGVQFVPIASLVRETLCATFSGLSKVYRAAGYRVGWVSFSGAVERAGDYLAAVELLSSMRMCAGVPAQHAVHAALGGYQSILDLTTPGGRLYESRRAVIEAVANSRFLRLTPPSGALYAFVEVRPDVLPDFNDQQFALELLEEKHVLVTPGSAFNVPYHNHFRTTILPDPATLTLVFQRIEAQLEAWSARHGAKSSGGAAKVVNATARFK